MTAEEKLIYDRKRLEYLEKWRPKLVIISMWWSANMRNPNEMDSLLKHLEKIGSRVLFIGDPPVLFFGNRSAPEFAAHMGLKPVVGKKRYIDVVRADIDKTNEEGLISFVTQRPYCSFLTVRDLYTESGNGLILDGDDIVYIDDDHLSHQGAMISKSRIRDAIQKMLFN